MRDFERLPAFPGGIAAEGIYNAGPMLADDTLRPTAMDAMMRLYTGADTENMRRYAGMLREDGFDGVTESDSAAYYAVSGAKGELRVYAYLTKATGVVRVILDPPGSDWTKLSGGAGEKVRILLDGCAGPCRRVSYRLL